MGGTLKSEDGSIVVVPSLAWTDDVGTLTDHLCAAAGRNLSPTELGTYVPGTAIEPTCSTEA